MSVTGANSRTIVLPRGNLTVDKSISTLTAYRDCLTRVQRISDWLDDYVRTGDQPLDPELQEVHDRLRILVAKHVSSIKKNKIRLLLLITDRFRNQTIDLLDQLTQLAENIAASETMAIQEEDRLNRNVVESGRLFDRFRRRLGRTLEMATALDNMGLNPSFVLPVGQTSQAPFETLELVQKVRVLGAVENFDIQFDLRASIHPALNKTQLYIAKRLDNTTKVLVKRPRIGDSDLDLYDPKVIERMDDEAYCCASLDHPRVIKIMGVFLIGLRPHLVFPYYENGDLVSYLAKSVGMDRRVDRVRMLLEVAEGLAYMHGVKPEAFVHGDIKPENVLITDEGHCVLTDFGLTKEEADDTSSHRKGAGTIPYEAPELLDEEHKTPASDVFAFGIMIPYVLSGHAPYSERGKAANNSTKLMKLVLAGERPRLWPAVADGELYSTIWDLAQECWAAEPLNRPTINEVVQALAAHISARSPDLAFD